MDVDRFLTGWLVMEGDDSRFGARQSELVQRLRRGRYFRRHPVGGPADGRVRRMWKWMVGPSVQQVVSRSIGWTPRSSTCSAHASEWVGSSMRQTSVPEKARRSLSPGRSRLKSPAPRTCSAAAFATLTPGEGGSHEQLITERLVRDCRCGGGFPGQQPPSHRLSSVAAGAGSPGDRHASGRT